MQNISMLYKSIVLYYCNSLRNTEQQRFPNENPRIASATEAILRGCKWVEGLFWNCHLNWRFGHTGTSLIAMNALGPLEGQETLPNRVGKQKIEKTDVVLSSSCLNLIICFLTSSIYLTKSVIIVYFTEIRAHASNFLNITFSLHIIEMYLDWLLRKKIIIQH